jgi:23S rRNA (uracil1939-C5)-methyltransferase
LRRRGAPDAVFALRECSITADAVLGVWRDIMAAARFFPDVPDLRGAVRVHMDGAASFALEGAAAWPRANELFAAVPALRSLWWTPERGRRTRIATRDPNAHATPDASFAQVNDATAPAMAAYVLGRVRAHAPDHVIDGYAGLGDGSVAMVNVGMRVTAIELDRDAADWAAQRIAPPSRVIAQRVEDALPRALPADVVVLNPPRTGVDRRVCEAIQAAPRKPRAVVYVSCDPATLARDVSRLAGWHIASLVCFDMFPQTAHVETVCELVPEAA